MSFGVSIGDVLLIATLGFKLWVNISGAKEEREELMTNLMDFKEKLESLKPILTDHAGMTPLDVKIANRKFEEAIVTLQVLEELNRKLVKGRAFRRAAWEVRGRATFREYQMKLEKRLHELENLSNCASMMTIKGNVLETKTLLKELTEFPDHKPIRFIDALNRQRLLPWDFCLTLEDFQNMVQACFKVQSAGRSFVERGEYDIINEENGALLRAENWTVRPGMTLSMAMVLQKLIEKGRKTYSCPACKTQYNRPAGIAAGPDLARVRW